jgi:GntR family transcriptional regulator, transcriptional repressor for pyruvate dehydrogenase complex
MKYQEHRMVEHQVTFAPSKPRRAFDDIIDQVRGMLRSGDLRPGQKLPSERDFALQLGVSRNTVREALRMLEIAGLVSLKKGHTGGAFVTASTMDAVAQGISDGLTLTEFSISDLMESRIALETFIARKAATEITEAELDELEASVARAKRIAETEDFPAQLTAHLDFHEKLAAAARNPILSSLAQPLLGLTHELALRVGPKSAESIWEERQELIEALRHRDPDAAANIVEKYIIESHARWLDSE